MQGTGLLPCRAWELSNWVSHKHNTDLTDKDGSCTAQTRTDHVLFTLLQEEQHDLVMTWIFRAHLHFINENSIFHSLVKYHVMTVSWILLLIVLLFLPRLSDRQYTWFITCSLLCCVEDGTQIWILTALYFPLLCLCYLWKLLPFIFVEYLFSREKQSLF